MAGTHFLNVDLDIYSKHDLRPLVEGLGRKVFSLYVGREGRKYCAHLEVAKITQTADSTIQAFCKLIEALPGPERTIWDRATVRSFSIGIQAGTEANACDFAVRPQTVRRIASVNAQIVVTIYGTGMRGRDPT